MAPAKPHLQITSNYEHKHHYTMAPFRFGTFIFNYQAIDVVGPFDLLTNSSRWVLDYIKKHGVHIDQATLDGAPEFEFCHIGESDKPVELLTSRYLVQRTHSVEDCPELDALLIGGPMPEDFSFAPSYKDFIKRHVAAGKLIFTTCTGASALATTGVLDGKNATVNNVEYNYVKRTFPQVKWAKDKKWVVDGNIWTGSGALAGMDMFAHWIKERFGAEYLRLSALGLDYEPRDIDGLFTVFEKRYDDAGQLLSTHDFPK
ncbi:hypothetical protein Q7P37_002905 [Cladosporium fusiforme]